ncbi:hypothetical protein F5Y15DRAFT_82993 [Xylariaceae sp. FL0016]|nr:hypothetical protein F5Y15DRAFT_82993 [Xylariaceae sp. FL0016]
MSRDHRDRGPIYNQDDSRYPPVPGEEEDRHNKNNTNNNSQTRPPMASGTVTLPSIQDPRGYGGYGPSPSSANGYPPPVYSPSGASGSYPPPAAPNHPTYLPPVQASSPDPRMNYPDPRSQPYYSSPAPSSYNGAASYDYTYQQGRPAPGAYPADYSRGGPPGGQVMQQSAPRQRTSIACKYCRRRKIRCSGYQHGGKCMNCSKMQQECIFQPVSTTNSVPFVPLSALPHGAPPGTQLYGAYGQPLPASTNFHPGNGNGYHSMPPGQHYDQPLPSPTGSYNSYSEDRSEPSRRRHRTSEDDHGLRLPPPSSFPDDNSRRRSPSSSSPGHLQPLQQPAHHSFDNRTPPPRGSPSGAPSTSASSVMSLENIMGSGTPSNANAIDQSMLGRLNRGAR